MRHRAGNDTAGFQGIQILPTAQPLGQRTGEQKHLLAILVHLGAGDDKAGGAAHPGQHGNILDLLLRADIHTFLKGHVGPLAAQLKAQAALGIKGKGGALQYFAGGDTVIQLLTAQMVGVAAKTFGTIFQHFRLLFSCMVYAPGRAGDPCKLLCSGFAKQTVMYYNKRY